MDAALTECVGDSLRDGRLAARDGVVHGVLERHASIAVALFAQASKQLQRNGFSVQGCCRDHLGPDRLQHTVDDWARDGDKRADIVGHWILLPFFANLHESDPSPTGLRWL